MHKKLVMIVLAMMAIAVWYVDSTRGAAAASASATAGTEKQVSADEKAVRLSAKEFTEAFNKGDAKAIGKLWTADGEYRDPDGRLLRGRESIEKEYASFFAEHAGLKLETSVSSVRILNDHAAIEDGTSILRKADGSMVSRASYTAVHLKEDGKWLMASVREYPPAALSARPNFRNLDWFVGDWVAAKDSRELSFAFRWIADKKFMELSYSVRDKGSVIRSGMQIVGLDPLSGNVVSWSFDSNGGMGRGLWRLLKKGALIESHGILPDGASTSSTEILSKIDENTFRWQSVNRTVAGQPLDDVEPVVLKRKTN